MQVSVDLGSTVIFFIYSSICNYMARVNIITLNLKVF